MLDIQNFKVMDEQKIEMLRQAINTHISMLYRQKDIYQRNGNTEGGERLPCGNQKIPNTKIGTMIHELELEEIMLIVTFVFTIVFAFVMILALDFIVK